MEVQTIIRSVTKSHDDREISECSFSPPSSANTSIITFGAIVAVVCVVDVAISVAVAIATATVATRPAVVCCQKEEKEATTPSRLFLLLNTKQQH